MTIRAGRDGWQVIVDAGLDPLTGKRRQITRQVNGSRKQAEKVEARLKTEVRQWDIIEGGTSTIVCPDRCAPPLEFIEGLQVDRRERVFWRP